MPEEVTDSHKAQILQDCVKSLNPKPPAEWAVGAGRTYKTTKGVDTYYSDHAFPPSPPFPSYGMAS